MKKFSLRKFVSALRHKHCVMHKGQRRKEENHERFYVFIPDKGIFWRWGSREGSADRVCRDWKNDYACLWRRFGN